MQSWNSSKRWKILKILKDLLIQIKDIEDNIKNIRSKKSELKRFFSFHTLFHATLLQQMEYLKESIQERAKHKREYDRRVNDRKMQLKEGKVGSSNAFDAGLAGSESKETESEKHVTCSRSGNDTHVEDADIKSVNDNKPMAEVQLIAQHNVLANEQQHSIQSEPIYDTHLLKKG
ncbi:hypothetical protein Tco_0024958 [Tanacetum coccineum]